MKKDRPHSSAVRIIGLGNGLRGDDAVGLMAARRIRQKVGDPVKVIEAEMAGVDLLELMKGAHIVMLIDAARSGQAPGTIHRLDASTGPIGGQMFPRSSHALGTVDALELARAMGVLPATVIVYGVEAGNTEAGQPLSPAVTKALDEVVEQIVQECEACRA
ncbi:MAG: hydrogenase maturation protease [Nitrospira sp.]|nr:hydrogenase maturation protease [Nitrospira sp.]MBH0183562.1 hydrogenase maturation protease [Nitrospira sp.]MBH0185918.1 hydrogenase maturation protease [Nitrospira sp.]